MSVIILCIKFFEKQLEEIIQGGLEGNEYVSLLSWVMNVYPGPELMAHPELKVDLTSLPPLIKEDSLKELEYAYLKVFVVIFLYRSAFHFNIFFGSDYGKEL